jgi:Flp pilus assembly protein TadD
MRSRIKQGRATGSIEAALGALAAAAFLGGCSERQAAEAPRPIVSTSAPIADTKPGPSTVGPIGPSVSPPSADEVRGGWREGVALFEQGDYKGASSRLRIAAEGRPHEAYAQYLLGIALWKSGDPAGAARALESAATLEPHFARTFINLARVRIQAGDLARGLAAADTALTIDPDSADALHQRGRALAGLGRADEALDTLSKAQKADPENGYIANTLGYLYIQKGRPQEALPFLEAARERLPKVAYVRNNLGVVYERLGRTAEALEEYREAIGAGDSSDKAAASLARLEPLVRRAGTAQEGPSTQGGTPVESNAIPGEAPENH